MQNVQWYLVLRAGQCQTILWAGTTAPATDDQVQEIETTHEWGQAVREMIAQDSSLRDKTMYIDSYEASLVYTHQDNGRWFIR